jgi:hypothetical protein
MSRVDDLFRRFEAKPFELAARLCRLPRDEEWRPAAVRWCERVTSLRPIPEIEDAESTFQLMQGATHGYVVLQLWLGAAREARTTYRGDEYVQYDATLLSAILAVWPVREHVNEYPSRLRNWALAITLVPFRADVPLQLAEGLYEFADVAYFLIEHPPLGRCTHEFQREPLFAQASLALTRRLRGCEPCDRDASALEKPSGAQYLAHNDLLFLLRRLLGSGKDVPQQLWPEVEHIIAGPRLEGWYRALSLLVASAPHQAGAVEHMAASVREHVDPAHAVRLLSGAIAGAGSPFTGVGWGRKGLGRKLLPISRVLLARGVWPTAALLACVTPDARDPQAYAETGDEPLYERVKDILGEALLERARDVALPVLARRRAIRALGMLAPTGEGANRIRALGQLKEDPITRPAVRIAECEQRDRSRKRAALDGETCIMDAWEHVMSEEPEPTMVEPAG